MNRIDLEGKTAVITGGCRGIGLATAQRMAASGARIAMWDIDVPAMERACADNPGFRSWRVDVTSEAGVAAAFRDTVRDLGQVDIFVNAAGVAGNRGPVAECEYGEWLRVLDVNLNGTFLCCREAIRHMRERGTGRIVNLSSMAGKEGNATSAHYSTSKAGVIALTKSMAKESLAGDIRINALAPSAIETDLFLGMPPDKQKMSLARIPMGRPGRVDEAAAMIAWMASDECSFTTGFTFDLSGGRATY